MAKRKVPIEEAVKFMIQSDESDIDSSHGGMSSDEEELLDDALLGMDTYFDENTDNVETVPPTPETAKTACPVDTVETLPASQSNATVDETVTIIEPNLEFCCETTQQISNTKPGSLVTTEESSSSQSMQPRVTSLRPRKQKPGTKRKNGDYDSLDDADDEDEEITIPKKKISKSKRPVDKTTTEEKSYESVDSANTLPDFTPLREPGLHLDMNVLRNVQEADFFSMFFTNDLINSIVKHTNTYAWMTIHKKKHYANKDGSWEETNPSEIKRFIALLLYTGIVHVPVYQDYWSIKTLYHGLWARSIMSRNRFKALLSMIHVVDPSEEREGDKLKKISPFIKYFRERCQTLFQPNRNLAVDERLVKSKHRSGIRQFIKNKPVKFGIKLWVIADSQTGYTCDFSVYTGSGDGILHSEHGLGYGVVMSLSESFLNQGYHIFFDNFYTSVTLVNNLFEKGTPSCGTVTENRKGFPVSLKGGKTWARTKERGDMRWTREGKTLCLQWKDNKVVTMLSTLDTGDQFVEVDRKIKKDGKFSKITVKQPYCVKRYNKYMNGVDKSDQHLSNYNILRKCVRWWKTLFFHLVDIAVVNGFILFQDHRAKNPDNDFLRRPKQYRLLNFRESVIRQLADLDEYGNPPIYKPFQDPNPSKFATDHLPKFTEDKRNCKVCYAESKQQLRVHSMCGAPQCQVYLHLTKDKNCFEKWHTTFKH